MLNNYYDLAMDYLEHLNFMRNTNLYNNLALNCLDVCENLAKHVYSEYVNVDEHEVRFLKTKLVHNIVRECNMKLKENFDYESLRKISDCEDLRYPGINFIELTKEECKLILESLDKFVDEVNEFLSRG